MNTRKHLMSYIEIARAQLQYAVTQGLNPQVITGIQIALNELYRSFIELNKGEVNQ